ncbi:H-NS family nucleoid-associated regulatory protein [Bradyrhizobium erythrophlei]|jgi:DNA-binding protein H-NS|nr:H-NS histone family protein [Bradyrhizobium erythrophlei]
MSKKSSFDAMSVDEMWRLHEEIGRILSVRLTSEKRELEKRLAQLHHEEESQPNLADKQLGTRQARKYPKVFPKYRNPNEPTETWSGRGKQPRWLTTALAMGHTIEEFVIGDAEAAKNNPRRNGHKWQAEK